MSGAGQDDDGAATQPGEPGASGVAAPAAPDPLTEAAAPPESDVPRAPVTLPAVAAEAPPASEPSATHAGAAAPGDNGAAVEPATAIRPGQIVVRFAGRSVVGLVREHNEDNLVIADLESGDRHPRDVTRVDEVRPAGLMFTVCDGMGGAAAGEVASRMAVDILHEALRRGGVPADRDTLARRLVSAVEEAGKRIYDAAQKERSRRGMGTTATAAVLADKILFIAEVGDSRAYLVRRGEMKQLTKDQSLVNQLIEAGHLTEAEAEAFEHSNIILQALGTAETVQVDLTFVELRRGDRLMMCSDGLSGLVHADMLRETLVGIADPAECAAKLIEYAEAAGGHDNITVVVGTFDGAGLDEARESDTFGYVQYPLPLGVDEATAFTDEETTASGMEPTSRVPGAGRTSTTLDGPSSRTWLVGGGVALAVSIGAWFLAESRERPDAAPPEDDSVAVARDPDPPTAPAAIVVRVRTDAERATLLVNGESRGELLLNQDRSLELAPGAYRFEAQADGTPIASQLVDVRGEAPMEVFLGLPSGTSAAAAAPAGEPAPPTGGSGTEPSGEPTEGVAAPAPVAIPAPVATPEPVAVPAPAPREPAPAVAVRTPRPPRVPRPRPPAAESSSTPTTAADVSAPPPPPKDIPDNPF
jgi:protein phosphatase